MKRELKLQFNCKGLNGGNPLNALPVPPMQDAMLRGWYARSGNVLNALSVVVAGLVPAISLREAQPCQMNRDGRDKPDHDRSR